jgi:hypothetical protein
MSKKLIESISDEKWEELVRFRQECVNIGSSTEPADWETAEKCITQLYRKMSWDKEITFHHVASPKAAQTLMQEKFGAEGYVSTSLWGSIDIYWIGYIRFLSTIEGIEADADNMALLDIWEELAKSCGWWYVVDEQTCVICDRPQEVHWNDSAMLHNDKDMAVRFRDGWGIYSYGGVRIEKSKSWIITNPETITIDAIRKEQNAEIRRIMQEQMGIPKYLDESGAKVIDMDSVKVVEGLEDTMPRCLMEDMDGRRFLVGTDGSTKRVYYMEVDPDVDTCVAAHNSISPFDESLIEGNS